jgi:hypothetical protein
LNWFRQALANDQAEIDAPPAPSLTWFRWLFAGFLFSFVFDYKSPELEFGAVSTGGSVFQFAFLGLAIFGDPLVGIRRHGPRRGVPLGK